MPPVLTRWSACSGDESQLSPHFSVTVWQLLHVLVELEDQGAGAVLLILQILVRMTEQALPVFLLRVCFLHRVDPGMAQPVERERDARSKLWLTLLADLLDGPVERAADRWSLS